MRLLHLAIILGFVTAAGCAKKQAAVPAKPTPSNSDPAAASPDATTPTPDKADGTRSPVKKGSDPCEGGQ